MIDPFCVAERMRKMHWKDTTSYSQREENRVPRSWSVDLGKVDVTIYRHIHYPSDVWLLKCNYLGLNRELVSQEVEAAKSEAVALVKVEIERKIVELKRQLDHFDSCCEDCGKPWNLGDPSREIEVRRIKLLCSDCF